MGFLPVLANDIGHSGVSHNFSVILDSVQERASILSLWLGYNFHIVVCRELAGYLGDLHGHNYTYDHVT